MFDLPQIKPEGMICINDDISGIGPFPGFHRELNMYFNNKYGHTWYLRPFFGFLRKVVQHAWDSALLENARKNAKTA